MGINLYCATCGARSLMQINRNTGYYGWYKSCACWPEAVLTPSFSHNVVDIELRERAIKFAAEQMAEYMRNKG